MEVLRQISRLTTCRESLVNGTTNLPTFADIVSGWSNNKSLPTSELFLVQCVVISCVRGYLQSDPCRNDHWAKPSMVPYGGQDNLIRCSTIPPRPLWWFWHRTRFVVASSRPLPVSLG